MNENAEASTKFTIKINLLTDVARMLFIPIKKFIINECLNRFLFISEMSNYKVYAIKFIVSLASLKWISHITP